MCKFLYVSLLQAQMPSRLIYSNSEDLDDFNLLKSAKIEFFSIICDAITIDLLMSHFIWIVLKIKSGLKF